MASVNQVMLLGNIGVDIKLNYMQNGNPVANMSIATTESYTGQDGNRVQKTEWHKIIVFGKQAENCHNYLHKGSQVFVEGKLQTRKWQDKQGQDRYVTEVVAQRVVFLDKKDNGNNDNRGNSYNYNGPSNDKYGDDVPF